MYYIYVQYMYSVRTDPVQRRITAAIGSTVDFIDCHVSDASIILAFQHRTPDTGTTNLELD